MPTYVCSAPEGLLDSQKKSAIAKAMTQLHAEYTGAPAYLVQTVIEEKPAGNRFLGGEPSADHIWVRADIRGGRLPEKRSALMVAICKDVSRISGVPEEKIFVYVCNLEPTDTLEYGRVLPQPGQEQAWFDALPESLKTYLRDLNAKNERAAAS
jgi:phenylpyruvate tautomerase PptA (4-oxalocrotonate tautomerase family)